MTNYIVFKKKPALKYVIVKHLNKRWIIVNNFIFQKTFKTKELPSIDEELAQIFPGKPSGSPQKDYTREPLKGKKVCYSLLWYGVCMYIVSVAACPYRLFT